MMRRDHDLSNGGIQIYSQPLSPAKQQHVPFLLAIKLHMSMLSQTKSSDVSRGVLKRVPQLFHPQLGAIGTWPYAAAQEEKRCTTAMIMARAVGRWLKTIAEGNIWVHAFGFDPFIALGKFE